MLRGGIDDTVSFLEVKCLTIFQKSFLLLLKFESKDNSKLFQVIIKRFFCMFSQIVYFVTK